MIAEKWDIVAARDMEEFALESHRRAIARDRRGPLRRARSSPLGDVARDESPRRDTSLEKMATLEPLTPGGRITAAVPSQISDGAAALLIASEAARAAHGLKPRARIHHLSRARRRPGLDADRADPGDAHALDKAGMTLADIDLVEINEAFASVVLAWQRSSAPTWRRSTSTAARSRSATRSARPARG